ncbi:hypothetical protein RFI_20387, partial [Reticulomyxa filosa]
FETYYKKELVVHSKTYLHSENSKSVHELTNLEIPLFCDTSSNEKSKPREHSHTYWPPDISLPKFLFNGVWMEFMVNGVLYPFYYCKTHLQTNVGELSGNALKDLYHQTSTIVKEFGFKALFHHTNNNNKKKGLYRGYVFNTFAVFPGIFAHVGVYTMCKHKFSELNMSNPIWHNTIFPFVSGLVAETVSVFAYVPQEVVQQRYILSHPNSGVTIWKTIRQVYNEHNRNIFQTFYRGTGAALLQYVPSSGVWWASYEAFKYLLHADSYVTYTIAGAMGGLATGTLTNPLDIARTRIQTRSGDYQQTNSFKLLRYIIKKEGFQGLTKGIAPRVALLTLEGTMFAECYEILLRLSKNH